jgi:hypothetical protein
MIDLFCKDMLRVITDDFDLLKSLPYRELHIPFRLEPYDDYYDYCIERGIQGQLQSFYT